METNRQMQISKITGSPVEQGSKKATLRSESGTWLKCITTKTNKR